MEFHFEAKLWKYEGKAAWYFVTLPQDVAADIKEVYGRSDRGFGSVRVRARIGETEWETSIFPDKSAGSYLLPIKKSVREKASIEIDSICRVLLSALHVR